MSTASSLCKDHTTSSRSGQIILCGEPFAIDWPVINFRDDTRYDATKLHSLPTQPASGNPNQRYRYWRRPRVAERPTLADLAKVIRQFVVHYDGLGSSSDCFHVLHDERGLSAHFLVDNDGTIYQTLDLSLMAYHAKGVNSISIGVELCNRGRVVQTETGYYQRHGLCRDQRQAMVHGQRFLMWDFTQAQYRAMIALGKALHRLLPGLPIEFPANGGRLIQSCIADITRFSGYLGHYHITRNKPDPGCFDFAHLCRELRQRPRWFFCSEQIDAGRCPQEIETASEKVSSRADHLPSLAIPENVAENYPLALSHELGPRWGAGLSLRLPAASAIYSPLAGRIVATRQAGDDSTESAAFVLTQHTVSLRGHEHTFFLLFLHADPSEKLTPWHKRLSPSESATFAERAIIYPSISIEAGELLGRTQSLDGPAGQNRCLHVQLLSHGEMTAAISPGLFRLIDASNTGLYAADQLKQIPTGGGKTNPATALQKTAKMDAHAQTMAVRYRSEYGLSDDYMSMLRRGQRFASLSRNQQRLLYQRVFQPTLFWTPELAERTGLPKDFIIWHYHPILFLKWLAEQLGTSSQTAVPSTTVDEGASSFVDQRDIHEGNDFLDQEDLPDPRERMPASGQNDTTENQSLPTSWPNLCDRLTTAGVATAAAVGIVCGVIYRRELLARRLRPRTSTTPGLTQTATVQSRGPSLIPLGRSFAEVIPVGNQLVLGSDPSIPNVSAVVDASVSRRHCRITATPQGFTLEDLGSRNGTFLNGQRIAAPNQLRNGDVISIGSLTQFRFKNP